MKAIVELSEEDLKAIRARQQFQAEWVAAGMERKEPFDFAVNKVLRAFEQPAPDQTDLDKILAIYAAAGIDATAKPDGEGGHIIKLEARVNEKVEGYTGLSATMYFNPSGKLVLQAIYEG